jgi:hypothetical protein
MDLDTFRNGLERRFIRNTPDVRLIDSVYRTRDQGKVLRISNSFGMKGIQSGLWLMQSGMRSSLWTHLPEVH